MKLSDIKKDIIVPKNQVIIDKKVIVDGKAFHALCAYEQNDCVEIIFLYLDDEVEEKNENIKFADIKTKRDELLLVTNSARDLRIHIDKIYIDNKEIVKNSSISGALFENHYDFFKLSYIMNLGVDLEYLEDSLLSNLIVCTIKIEGKTLSYLDLDNAKTLKITRFPSYETLLGNIDFNITKDKKEYSFKDKDNVEHKFKARLSEVDIWGEIVPQIEKNQREAYEKFDEKEKELYHSSGDFTVGYEKLCPKGMNLLCVAYESEEQLNFYTKEHLNSEVEKNNQFGFSFGFSGDAGERISYLDPVEKGKVESIEVELFSWVKSRLYDDIIVDLR